jgi:hypothetical protein
VQENLAKTLWSFVCTAETDPLPLKNEFCQSDYLDYIIDAINDFSRLQDMPSDPLSCGDAGEGQQGLGTVKK